MPTPEAMNAVGGDAGFGCWGGGGGGVMRKEPPKPLTSAVSAGLLLGCWWWVVWACAARWRVTGPRVRMRIEKEEEVWGASLSSLVESLALVVDGAALLMVKVRTQSSFRDRGSSSRMWL